MPTYRFDANSQAMTEIPYSKGDTIIFQDTFYKPYFSLVTKDYVEIIYGFTESANEPNFRKLRISLTNIQWSDLSELNFVLQGQNDGLFAIAKGKQALDGSALNDLLYANDLGSTLKGAGGDDKLYGVAGDNVLDGGDGDDFIVSRAGNDQLYGGAGNDWLDAMFVSLSVTVVGGSGNDTLIGGASGDQLIGGTGDDDISDFGGNNTIEGGDGNDTITAFIAYMPEYQKYVGNDLISGGNGDDKIRAGDKNDTISGDAGNDAILANQGDDIVHGGSGSDMISGGAGDDLIFGDAGNDRIVGGVSLAMAVDTNLINYSIIDDHGGEIIENIVAREQGAGNDSIDGGDGFDLLYYPGSLDRYTITIANDAINILDKQGESGSDTIKNVEAIIFDHEGISFDTNTSIAQTYRLYQAAFGRVPDQDGLGYWFDSLQNHGSTLRDIAQSFINSTEFKLHYGEKTTTDLILNAFYQNILGRAPDAAGLAYWKNELSSGKLDLADVLVSFSESAENKQLTAPAIKQGIHFNYFASSAGQPDKQTMWGDAGINFLSGGVGDDRLFGFAGNDVLLGGTGNDLLAGGDGNDDLQGAAGNDSLWAGTGKDQLDGGAGVDTAYFGAIDWNRVTTAGINDYSIERQGDVLIVRDKAHPENVTQVKNVERLGFVSYIPGAFSHWGTKVLAFDIDGNAGQAYQLFFAATGHSELLPWESAELTHLILDLDRGSSLSTAANNFLHRGFFIPHDGNLQEPETFINTIYLRALGRTADAAGLAYWKQELTSGHLNAGDVLVAITQSSEFQAIIVGKMPQVIQYDGSEYF